MTRFGLSPIKSQSKSFVFCILVLIQRLASKLAHTFFGLRMVTLVIPGTGFKPNLAIAFLAFFSLRLWVFIPAPRLPARASKSIPAAAASAFASCYNTSTLLHEVATLEAVCDHAHKAHIVYNLTNGIMLRTANSGISSSESSSSSSISSILGPRSSTFSSAFVAMADCFSCNRFQVENLSTILSCKRLKLVWYNKMGVVSVV